MAVKIMKFENFLEKITMRHAENIKFRAILCLSTLLGLCTQSRSRFLEAHHSSEKKSSLRS
jgi:hypothetical protein